MLQGMLQALKCAVLDGEAPPLVQETAAQLCPDGQIGETAVGVEDESAVAAPRAGEDSVILGAAATHLPRRGKGVSKRDAY